MARMKEIQKSKFLDWTDEAGRLTRFFRIGQRQDLVAGDVKPKELTVTPTTSTQIFTATDDVNFDKVTVLPSQEASPTVTADGQSGYYNLVFNGGAMANNNTLSL